MKLLLQICFSFFCISILSAQDLIYTISGEVDQQKISLDSILVENLSNDTRLLFDNLPVLDYYQINLSQNVLWGTVKANNIEMKQQFVEIINLPGLIQVAYRGNVPTEARLSVFNINGQLVYTTGQKTVFPNNSVRLQLTTTGIFFVKIQSPLGVNTFKAVGIEGQNHYNFEITEENSAGEKFKSSFIATEEDFTLSVGDSIRISVYKEDYYAPPASIKVSTSETINFKFKISSVAESGISDAYVELNENTTNVAAYDTLGGQVVLEYSGEKPDLKPGDIITVDVDTMGYLRKVVETIEEDESISITTTQAFLSDVFVEKEVKLNTGLMNPGIQLKSTSSREEISRALTDEEGYIHPVEVIVHDRGGNLITKSALTKSDTVVQGIVPLIDFKRDRELEQDLYGKEGDNVHFYVDEGLVSLTSNAVFEFYMDYDGELDKDTKIKKGELKTFKFYLDSEADFLLKLALDAQASYKKEKTKKLVDLEKVTAKFLVGPVYVWITFDVDIFGHYEFNVDAALHSDWGFESSHNLKIGGLYDRETDIFTPIQVYKPAGKVFPLNVEGELNAFARMEIYPRAEVKFYDFFGPYAEIVPYVEGNYNAAFQSQLTGSGTETFLAWNSNIDLGMDFRTGAEMTFLDIDLLNVGPAKVHCFDLPIWKSPANIQLLTDLPEEVKGGTMHTLKFKVTDLLENPVGLCPVYLSGEGSFDKQIVISDLNGEVTVNWILPSDEGEKEASAIIYKADKSVMNETFFQIRVRNTAPEVTTLLASELTHNSGTMNGVVGSDGGSSVFQRGFYWCKACGTPGENDSIATVDGTTGLFSYKLANLEPETIYNYVAFAKNSVGTTVSDVFATLPTSSAPDADAPEIINPADFSIYNRNNTDSITIQWNAVEEAEKYWLNIFPDGQPASPVFNDSVGSVTSKTVAVNILENGIYLVQVKAKAAGGKWSEFSEARQFIADTPPVAPSLISPENEITLLRNTLQKFSWTNSSEGNCSYNICIVKGTDLESSPVYDDKSDELNDSVDCYWEPGTYSWSVRAMKQPPEGYSLSDYKTAIGWGNFAPLRTFTIYEPPSGTFTDSRDGQSYDWVRIGGQVWMAENLAWLPAVDIPDGKSRYEDTVPVYYVYGSSTNDVNEAKANTNYSTYGVLYNYIAASGACPDGWHLPSAAEWEELARYISDTMGPYETSSTYFFNRSVHLKATSGWLYNGNGSDDFGFSAMPGGQYGSGYVQNLSQFGGIGDSGYWWSDTKSWIMYNSTSTLYGQSLDRGAAHSIRCIRD